MKKLTLFLLLSCLSILPMMSQGITWKKSNCRSMDFSKIESNTISQIGEKATVKSWLNATYVTLSTDEVVTYSWAAERDAVIESNGSHTSIVRMTGEKPRVKLTVVMRNTKGDGTGNITVVRSFDIPVKLAISGEAKVVSVTAGNSYGAFFYDHKHLNGAQAEWTGNQNDFTEFEWDIPGFVYHSSNPIGADDEPKSGSAFFHPTSEARYMFETAARVRVVNKRTGWVSAWSNPHYVRVTSCTDFGMPTQYSTSSSRAIGIEQGLSSVKVYSFTTGAVVHQEKGVESFDINNTRLARGIYIVEMQNTDGEVKKVKVSKSY